MPTTSRLSYRNAQCGNDSISFQAYTLKNTEATPEDLRNCLRHKITNDSIFKRPLTALEVDSVTPEELRKRLNFKEKAPQNLKTNRLNLNGQGHVSYTTH